jgi:hypothetical protein
MQQRMLWSAKVWEANTANVSTSTNTQMSFGRYVPASGYDALLASYDHATNAGKQKPAAAHAKPQQRE